MNALSQKNKHISIRWDVILLALFGIAIPGVAAVLAKYDLKCELASDHSIVWTILIVSGASITLAFVLGAVVGLISCRFPRREHQPRTRVLPDGPPRPSVATWVAMALGALLAAAAFLLKELNVFLPNGLEWMLIGFVALILIAPPLIAWVDSSKKKC